MRDCLKKSGALSRVANVIDSSLKLENLPINFEELLITLVRLSSFSTGEALGFIFCITMSQNKLLVASARRILKLKVGDTRSPLNFSDMPDELRMNFLNFLQTDEVILFLQLHIRHNHF
jgi:spore maturation protein SpmB